MRTVTFTSSKPPFLSIFLREDAENHLKRHFDIEMPGSKFFFDSPESLFQTIVNDYADIIRKSGCNEMGIKTVSITFPSVIGNCNVVSISDLSVSELSTLRIVPRGEALARCIASDRLVPTKECQLILDKGNNIITAYPGELAPPLPASPDIHDEYWDSHVFIEPISSK